MKLMLAVALAIASVVLAEPEAANSEVHFVLGQQEYRYVLDNFEQAVPIVPATPEEPAAAPEAVAAPAAPAAPAVHVSIPLALPAVPYHLPVVAHVPAVAPAAPAVTVSVPAVPAITKGAFGPIALPAGYHQSVIDQNLARLPKALPTLPVPVEAPEPEAEAPASPVEAAPPVPAVAPVHVFPHVPVAPVAPVAAPVAAPEAPAAPAVVGQADPNLVYSVIPHAGNPLYGENAPTHYLGKREAEADPEAEAAVTWYGLHYNPLSGCKYNPYNCGYHPYGHAYGHPYGYPYWG